MKVNENTCIVGIQVILVPYRPHHVLKYHEWMKSPELQHLTASEPLSLEQEYDMQKSWHADEDKCTFIILEKDVVEQSGDEVAAMIGDTNMFLNTKDTIKEAEIEIMIAEESARGRKRGWESVLLMLHYGCEVLNIKKFLVKIGTDNKNSINLFSKVGFMEVSKSDVFSEVTLEKLVTDGWQEWLRLQIKGAVTVDYSEKFNRCELGMGGSS